MKNKSIRFPENRKKALLTLIFFVTAISVMAQNGDGGTAGITKATETVTGYFDPATKLMYAVAAVLGLIGAIKVFQKWSNGDPDTQKVAAGWFGSCIFLVVVSVILRAFFL